MRRLMICATVILAFCLSGCKQNVDLAGVRTFAATVGDAEPSYTAIAGDYYGTCLRSAGWERLIAFETPASSDNTAPEIRIKKIDVAPLQPGDSLILTPELRRLIEKANEKWNQLDGKILCDSSIKPVADDWTQLNEVVVGYVAALGAVAGGQKATDFGFGALTGSLRGLNGDQGTALSDFLNTLANEAINAERRPAITAAAVKADAALQVLVKIQEDAANNYKARLLNERGRIDSFYRDSFNLSRPRLFGPDVISAEVQWQAKLDEVAARNAAADAYIQSVRSIGQTHKALIDDLENNRFDHLYAVATAFVAEFKPEIAALHDAFK